MNKPPLSQFDSQGLSGHILTWLKSWDFYDNPFKVWDAAREPDLQHYYVKPPFYEQMLTEPVSSLVYACRGGGKSAALRMLAAECRPQFSGSSVLAVPFTDFSPFAEDISARPPTFEEYIKNIITLTLEAALRDIWKRARQESPPKEKTILQELRYWIEQYAPYLLTPNLANVLNTGAPIPIHYRYEAEKAFRAFWSEVLRVSPVPPQYSFNSLTQTIQIFITFIRNLLSTDRYPCAAVYVLVDGIDEYLFTQDDANAAATIIKPILGNLRFLETPGLAVKFFLPLEFRTAFDATARTDRLQSYVLQWKPQDEPNAIEKLRHLLRNRIRYFNTAGIHSLADMCVPGLRSWIEDALLEEAQGVPRNVLRLGNQIFVEHCRERPDLESEITQQDWERALSWFRGTVLSTQFKQTETSRSFTRTRKVVEKPTAGELRLRMDLKAGRVFLGDKELAPLPDLEFRLLAYLYRRKGEICSRDEIIQAVYTTQDGVSDETLGSLVYRLRKRIQRFSEDPSLDMEHFIRTVRGRGYTLDHTYN